MVEFLSESEWYPSLLITLFIHQGCLAPVRVIIPKGSILDPSPEAAVVGGNVLTSQRVVDVILGAFGACSASQVWWSKGLGAAEKQRGGGGDTHINKILLCSSVRAA